MKKTFLLYYFSLFAIFLFTDYRIIGCGRKLFAAIILVSSFDAFGEICGELIRVYRVAQAHNPFLAPVRPTAVAECASFRLIYNEDYNKQTNLRQ